MKAAARRIGAAAAAAPSFTIETITPAIAEKYLAQNKATNRRVSGTVVKRYADAMRRGEWQLNGEALKFDELGNLIDGQHRLRAVVAAGVAVQMGIFRALPAETFKTIDTGRARTPGDVLSIARFAYPNELAAAARLLFAYLNGDRWTSVRSVRVSNAEHLVLVRDRSGTVCYDAQDRPRLAIRKHDWQLGWFDAVAERHGEHSLEVMEARRLLEASRQIYFDFGPEEAAA